MPRLLIRLAPALPLLLLLIPFRDALRTGEAAGAGPDVVTTLWTMWWFQQEWTGPAWGGHSVLFNFPFGGDGAILSPITAVTWALAEPLMGPAAATTFTDLTQLGAFTAAVMLLGRAVGLSRLGVLVAGLAVIAQRYPIYAIGETSVVGITALPVPVGLLAMLRICGGDRRRRWVALAAGCVVLQALESPYLAPVLPAAGLILLWPGLGRRALGLSADGPHPWRRLLVAVGVGFLGVIGIGLLHRGATFAYEGTEPYGAVGWGSALWQVIERPWSRATIGHLLWPGPVQWSTEIGGSIHAQGRDYLALSGVLLAILGAAMRPARAALFAALAAVGFALSTGSDWFGAPGPFALLNAITLRVARGLTQPTRYLMLVAIGVPIAAGWGAMVLAKRWRPVGLMAAGVVLIDGLMWGGTSLQLPTMTVPAGPCLDWLDDREGGALVWPWDGVDDEWMGATLVSRTYQVAHGRPGATVGTGSWPLDGKLFPGHTLRAMGWKDQVNGTGTLDLQTLADWGYRWMLVDTQADPELLHPVSRMFKADDLVKQCPTAAVYRMPEPRPDAPPPTRPEVEFTPHLIEKEGASQPWKVVGGQGGPGPGQDGQRPGQVPRGRNAPGGGPPPR